MIKAIILLRTSTTDQNPELQRKECEEFVKEQGWELVKVFERQESAYKSEKGVWNEEIEWAKENAIRRVVVWNMDRFSRLPEDRVLKEVKILATMYDIKICAVKGDSWSKIVESIGNLKELGFIGEALGEFLEKLLQGLEFQRSHRESKVKSERVRLAVRKEEGKETKSYKGNKWGRKSLSTQAVNKILTLREQGHSITQISKEVQYADKNKQMKNVSVGAVHKILTTFHKTLDEGNGQKGEENAEKEGFQEVTNL